MRHQTLKLKMHKLVSVITKDLPLAATDSPGSQLSSSQVDHPSQGSVPYAEFSAEPQLLALLFEAPSFVAAAISPIIDRLLSSAGYAVLELAYLLQDSGSINN